VCISSHVGPVVGGVLPVEENVEQEVPGGPQASSCEELKPALEQGKPQCI
jgi:hypothetical protein